MSTLFNRDVPASDPIADADVALLDVADMRVRYGGVEAVSGASIRINAPEIVGLIGPNGAGKSSLLAAIGGQATAAGGRVSLGGVDVTRLAAHRRARLGIVRTFQTASVFDRLTVFENLLVAGCGFPGAGLTRAIFGGAAQRSLIETARAHAGSVLAELDLQIMSDSYGAELSGGQRRLVEIGRCLMCSPRVLLLDEPMVGVAPHLVKRIGETCRQIRDSGVAIIIVEHALEVIETFCDRVVVMAAGQVLDDGSYEAVMRNGSVRDAYLA
ncbi:MAG: ABC transporter ATP-binding protein [Solirubrobacteraceae bacterium]